MKHLILALVALFSAACGDMPVSPVAPSATSPAGPSVTAPPAPRQTYTVSLSANGGGLVGLWQSTLAVSPVPTGQAVPPVEVTLNCGNGTAPQALPGFLGLKIVSCTFASVGDYTVTATVIAPNTETFSASTVVSVMPPPPPPPPATLILSINANRIGGTATSAEWRFAIVSTETLTDIQWDFGDDSGSSSGRTVEQHRYLKEGSTTVRVFANAAAHGPVMARAEIEVKFN